MHFGNECQLVCSLFFCQQLLFVIAQEMCNEQQGEHLLAAQPCLLPNVPHSIRGMSDKCAQPASLSFIPIVLRGHFSIFLLFFLCFPFSFLFYFLFFFDFSPLFFFFFISLPFFFLFFLFSFSLLTFCFLVDPFFVLFSILFPPLLFSFFLFFFFPFSSLCFVLFCFCFSVFFFYFLFLMISVYFFRRGEI